MVFSSRRHEVPLLTRQPPRQPSVYRGGEVVDDYAVLCWDTVYGVVGLAYSLISPNGSPRRLVDALWGRHGQYLPQRYAAVAVGQVLWLRAPEIDAIDIYQGGRLSDPYQPSWQQLAGVLGTNAPWWHTTLRDRDAILAWKPGVPPAIVPACDVELRTEPLTALAADEPDGSPAAAVCLWLARTIRVRSDKSARNYLKDIDEQAYPDCAGLTLGAVPAPLRRPAPDPLPEVVRRAGWIQIVERRDTLAAAVADIVQRWDGGGDWPMGARAEVDLHICPTAAEWAQRLERAPAGQPPTVLERELLRMAREHLTAQLLHDPATGLPALRHRDHAGEEWIVAAVPQRLPTTAALTSVTLSGVRGYVVWIRTADGGLWIAPEHPNHGLSWGYSGGGPLALAILLDRLLDDITAPAVESYHPKPPPALEQLLELTPQDEITTYTREQLEAAQLGEA